MRKYIHAAGAACLAVSLFAPRATASSDEVTPAEDNPPGCTTAGFGNSNQCGAQGRSNFNDANHQKPIDACKTQTAPSGSTITRILPDGPRRADHSLAFISGACVYLPINYFTQNPPYRYPVIYLLHGGGGDEADWVWQGQVQSILDDYARHHEGRGVIAVMPDGFDGQWHDFYDHSWLIEDYFLHYLIPYVDRHFRTIADRHGRAVVGLSNGGYGALEFAAKAPDMFIAAGGMSSNVGGRDMSGFGTPWAPGTDAVQNQEFGSYYYGNTPTPLASNLDDVAVTMDLGTSCANEEDVSTNLCLLVAVDTSFRFDNEAFRDAMARVRHVGAFEYRESEGTHTWRWWRYWFRERQLPFVMARLLPPQFAFLPPYSMPLPASFRYRSIASHFTIYGYDVTVTRPHPEFLDLTEVSAAGLTLTGTGSVAIVTPPIYKRNTTYAVNNAPASTDRDGRLRFTIDLGPGHADEQYSPAARLQEASGQYTFVTQKVSIAGPVVVEAARQERLPETGDFSKLALLGGLLCLLALGMNRLRTAE